MSALIPRRATIISLIVPLILVLGVSSGALAQTPPVADVNCDVYGPYYEATTTRFILLNTEYADGISESFARLETDRTRAIAELRAHGDRINDLADEQSDISVPEGLEELQDHLMMVLESYAEAFPTIADAIEARDYDRFDEIDEIINEAVEMEREALAELDDRAADCGLPLAPRRSDPQQTLLVLNSAK